MSPGFASPSAISPAGSGYAPISTLTNDVPVYSTYASSCEAAMYPGGSANGNGNDSGMATPRYVPQGFNALAISSGRGSDGRGFGGGGQGQSRGGGAFGGQNGRGLYASPYAGWIDGRGHEDQMGVPGPGWEYYSRYQDLQHQQQRQQQQMYSQDQQRDPERGLCGGDEVPRKSV